MIPNDLKNCFTNLLCMISFDLIKKKLKYKASSRALKETKVIGFKFKYLSF